jgi:hypothetical protein
MRLRLHSVVSNVVVLTSVALLFVEQNASAAVPAIDPASAVRGALGVSLDDLMLSNMVGSLSLYLNAGFLLLFFAAAVILTRAHARTGTDTRSTAAAPQYQQGHVRTSVDVC